MRSGFFNDPLPSAGVLVMGHAPHDRDLGAKRVILQKAYEALPTGGARIVHEALIEDKRRSNAFGLLMSLVTSSKPLAVQPRW